MKRTSRPESFPAHLSLAGSLALLGATIAVPATAQPQMPPAPVSVAEVREVAIAPTVPVSATIYSRNDVQVTVGVDGQLTFVAEPGTRVAKGEIIARVDDGPLRLQIGEQQALAARARAQLTFLDSQLKRQQSLRESESLSANQLEETRSNRDVAASDLAIAEARIGQIQDQIARSTVRAAFDGVIVERMRREGEDVGRGAVVARIIDVDRLEVRAFIPLRYGARVRAGDALEMFGYESRYNGVIRAVIPAADPRSQTFEVRVDLPAQARQAWSVGQLVSISVPIKAASASLAVPRDALILRQEGTYVFRISDDNLAQRVAVELGDTQGELVAVRGDLQPGQRIAIRGAETLRDGQTVNVIAPQHGAAAAAAP